MYSFDSCRLVPFQEIVSDDGAIEFSTVTEEESSDEVATPKEEDDTKAEETDDTSIDKQQKNDIDNDDNDEDTTPEVEYMMEEKLRKLYEASHEFGKDQMRIKLQTVPRHCELVSLLFIPYLTRNAVKEAPSLKHVFRNMFREFEKIIHEKGELINITQLTREGFGIGVEYANSRMQYNKVDDFFVLESTVIAQVLVTCDEVFSVTDAATGMLIQGDGEKQRVYHLVRLEVAVKQKIPTGGGKATNEVGSWQIVDWDDLVGGNLWFV